MPAPAVNTIGLRKTYGSITALEHLDLSIAPGEFFTLLGPSGSGKTTTLRLIAGFEQPDTGAIELDGDNVTRRPPYQRDVNTVFQDYALFPHMTVAENVAYGLKIRGSPRKQRAQQANDALQMVRLADVGARKPIQLSGGQRQRVALARALVNRPRVLLLDEPLGALDLKLRQEMQLELQRIQRDLADAITFIYVTHDQDEALTMSDRIAVFSTGRVEQVGTPKQVYEEPANEFVAGFVGTSNILERDGRRYTIRPEKVQILGLAKSGGTPRGPDPGSGASTNYPAHPPHHAPEPGGTHVEFGVIREVIYLGSVTRYVVELEQGETLVALRQNLEPATDAGPEHTRGQRVQLAWGTQHVKAVDAVEDATAPQQHQEEVPQ